MELTENRYKVSEVGVIPGDWNVFELSELVDFLDGKRRPIKDSDRAKMKGQYPYFGASGIIDYVNDFLFDDELILLGEDGENILSRNVRLAFKVSGKIWVNNHAHVLKPKEHIVIGFLTEKLESLNYEKYNSGTAQPKLNQKTCSIIQVSLPPTKSEQTAIATAISDVNELIENLEKLIAKKQDIRECFMQNFFSPKDNWQSKLLPEVCWFQEGPGLRNWQFTTKGIKVINVTNLENGFLNIDNTDRFISLEEFHSMYEHFEVNENDIVIASSGNSYGKVGVVRKQDLPLVMNTSVIRFKPLKGLDYYYLLTFLKSKIFKKQIDFMITGGAQPNFGPAHLKQVLIPIPPTMEQQIEISEIIKDLNEEIFFLEKKYKKYKNIRQGMMQTLLTGKIRLI